MQRSGVGCSGVFWQGPAQQHDHRVLCCCHKTGGVQAPPGLMRYQNKPVQSECIHRGGLSCNSLTGGKSVPWHKRGWITANLTYACSDDLQGFIPLARAAWLAAALVTGRRSARFRASARSQRNVTGASCLASARCSWCSSWLRGYSKRISEVAAIGTRHPIKDMTVSRSAKHHAAHLPPAVTQPP